MALRALMIKKLYHRTGGTTFFYCRATFLYICASFIIEYKASAKQFASLVRMMYKTSNAMKIKLTTKLPLLFGLAAVFSSCETGLFTPTYKCEFDVKVTSAEDNMTLTGIRVSLMRGETKLAERTTDYLGECEFEIVEVTDRFTEEYKFVAEDVDGKDRGVYNTETI